MTIKMPHSLTRHGEHNEKCRKKYSLFPCGWPNNSIFWRKKYYGLKFLFSFFILFFLLFIYAQILYFWTIYLPFCVCAVLIVKDLKTIKDFYSSSSFFLPCYCCCSTVQWEIYIFFVVWLYVSFIIIMYGMYLLLHRWESHFLSLLPIVVYVVAGCQYNICYIAKLKRVENIFIDEIIIIFIDLSIELEEFLQLARIYC